MEIMYPEIDRQMEIDVPRDRQMEIMYREIDRQMEIDVPRDRQTDGDRCTER